MDGSSSPSKPAAKKRARNERTKKTVTSENEVPFSNIEARGTRVEQNATPEMSSLHPKKRRRSKKEVKDEENVEDGENETMVEPPIKKIRPTRKAAAKKNVIKHEKASDAETEAVPSPKPTPKPIPKSKRGPMKGNDEVVKAEKKVANRSRKTVNSEVCYEWALVNA